MKTLNAAINTHDKISHINREIYGHFSEHLGRCIYDGIGEKAGRKKMVNTHWGGGSTPKIVTD